MFVFVASNQVSNKHIFYKTRLIAHKLVVHKLCIGLKDNEEDDQPLE